MDWVHMNPHAPLGDTTEVERVGKDVQFVAIARGKVIIRDCFGTPPQSNIIGYVKKIIPQ
jgi:hypothetical protein